MKASILATYDLNLGLARMLTSDISADRWTTQFGKMVNHPAWQIGHLATSSGSIGKLLGAEPWIDPGSSDLFGMGSTPVDDAGKYPGKDDLVAALTDGHARVKSLFEQADDAVLAQDLPAGRMRERFGTVGNFAVFMMTMHEAYHLGQLSHWRKAAGLGSVL